MPGIFVYFSMEGLLDDYLFVEEGFHKTDKSPGMMIWQEMGENIALNRQISVL